MSTNTIEIIKTLNPLYYSLPKDKTEYGIFKNLNNRITINLDNEIEQTFKDSSNFRLNHISDNYKTENKKDLDVSEIKSLFIGKNSFLDRLQTEKDTLFILLDTFEPNSKLIYKDGSILSQIYKEFYSSSDNGETRKNKFSIRVYSNNRDMKNDSIKSSIDIDIKNIIKEIQKYHSRNPEFKEFKKIRYLTNFDGIIDYFTLNIDSIKIRKDIKLLKELVMYTEKELINNFKQEYDKIDFDGKIIGKIDFYINPTVDIPPILRANYDIDEFSTVLSEEGLKNKKIKIREIKVGYESKLIELKRYLTKLDSQIENEEKIVSSQFNRNEVYELHMMLGVNGKGFVNLTTEKHDKSFRYKKNSGIIMDFSGIDMVLTGSISHQKPNSYWVVFIRDYDRNVIVTMDIKIFYGELKNTFVVMNVYDIFKHASLKDSDNTLKISEIEKSKYMKFFKFEVGSNVSKLINYKGELKRKTLSPKNLIFIEPLNLLNTGINEKFYIYPLIELTDESINKYFKNKEYSYEDFATIFINTEKLYEFYIFISTNYPRQVYDTSNYSNEYKINKIESNTKFIIDKLLEKKRVFRPKKIIQDKTTFKGIYKILKHDVISSLVIDETLITPKIPEKVEGTCIVLDPSIKQKKHLESGDTIIQAHDAVSLYKYNESTILNNDGGLPCKDKIHIGKSGTYNVNGMVTDKENKNDSGYKIVRSNVKLYVTQNNIDKIQDIDCLVRRQELKHSFFSLLDGFQTSKERRLGDYI